MLVERDSMYTESVTSSRNIHGTWVSISKWCTVWGTLHTDIVNVDIGWSIAQYTKTESSVSYISVTINAFTNCTASVLPTCMVRGERHNTVPSVTVTGVSNGSRKSAGWAQAQKWDTSQKTKCDYGCELWNM